MMQRCSERAFAMCPSRHLCGPIHEATFSDDSDCAKFNRKVESIPVTNADNIRTMSDEELARFLYRADDGNLTVDVCDEKYCDPHHCQHDCTSAILRWLQQPVKK